MLRSAACDGLGNVVKDIWILGLVMKQLVQIPEGICINLVTFAVELEQEGL